ncbi:ATP-binding protein [Streptomyces sp. S1D4-20]|uniref:ATP-binding protein n=1 Tax=Streptomyces sp. S1D4-20 TaxID=2594462 RepID=UPI001164EF3C|nr:ATP-binding protein [Streptomyces sp. S1D4-20]QDN54251.1 ATP-binding protein [Streptomyces sp. S1D4-20]
MPPTTEELIREHLGERIEHRDIDLTGLLAPQQAARRAVGNALNGRARQEQLDDAILVTNELVGNSVQHGNGPVGLSLDIYEKGAAVGVVDRDSATSAVRIVTPDLLVDGEGPVAPQSVPDGGRGMFLVAQFATAWSVHSINGGKLVLAVFVLTGGRH